MVALVSTGATIAHASDGAWQRLSSGADGAKRQQAAGAFDAIRQRLVVFGGSSGVLRNDVTEFSTVTLTATPLATAGVPPSPRRLHRAVLDVARDRLLVFGGYDGTVVGDLWELSFAITPPTWTQLFPAGPIPSPRAGHVLALDEAGDRLVLFGGFDGVTPGTLRRDDVWVLPLGAPLAWQPVTPVGPGPGPRSSAASAFDPSSRRLIVHGGTSPSFLSDTWALDLTGTPEWIPLASTGPYPVPREEHSLVHDPVSDRVVLFGGYPNTTFAPLGDTWALPLAPGAEWDALAPAAPGGAPAPRWGHVAAWDPVRSCMLVHAGYEFTYRSDTWALHGDVPTATMLALVSAEVHGDRGRLRWLATGASGTLEHEFEVERRNGDSPWAVVGRVAPQGDGAIQFDDGPLARDRTYDYRLAWNDGAGRHVAGAATLHVAAASLGVHAVAGGTRLRCSLPTASQARLVVVDVRGRAAGSHVLPARAGEHEVAVSDLVNAPGVYFACLVQDGVLVTTRFATRR